MVPGRALVPVLVIAGEPRHELLRVLHLHVRQKSFCHSRAERRRSPAVMADDHNVTDQLVLETPRCASHGLLVERFRYNLTVLWHYGIMLVKMTFSLDEETAARLERAAETLRKPKSMVVREAIRDYSERLGRLSDDERERLLGTFDLLVAEIPERPASEVDRELAALRQARRHGGRKTGTVDP